VIARAAGLKELVAEVLPDNMPMRKVFENSARSSAQAAVQAACATTAAPKKRTMGISWLAWVRLRPLNIMTQSQI
jgi:hypothetical protein